jgi:putative aldouronate transport system substrate-binding protein
MGIKWRSLAFVLLAVMLVFVTACSESQTAAPENKLPDAKEPSKETITYKVFRKQSAPGYPKDGGKAKEFLLNFAKERGVTGVDFEVTFATGDEYTTKLNLLAAAGNLPDYFDVDLQTLNRFAADGLIIPLDDYLKDMKNYKKFARSSDLEAARFQGKTFGFPNGFRPEPINQPAVSTLNIRMDWLEKLKLKIPETLDELYEIIKAFTNNDPDGNSKNDTYGLGSDKSGNFDAIFGAFGINPTFYHLRDGQLKSGSVLPETKEVLALLQKWYKEKLIDPEFMIIDSNQKEEKVINSKLGVYTGTSWNLDPVSPFFKTFKATAPTAKLDSIAPPKGPKGSRGVPEIAPGNGLMNAISTKTKDPERWVKFLDAALDTPGEEPFAGSGVPGVDYIFDKAQNRFSFPKSADDLLKSGWGNPILFIKVVDRRWITDQTMAKSFEIANKYVIKNESWNVVQANRDYPDLNKLWKEYFVKIISGELPIDAWNEYVDKYYKQGGKEVEKQINEAYKK